MARLSQSIESIDVTDTIYGVAETSDVEIIKITSPGVMTEIVGELTTPVLPLTIESEGEIPDLIVFVRNLSRKFSTGVVTSVNMEVPQITEEEEEELKKPSIKVELSIHSYQSE